MKKKNVKKVIAKYKKKIRTFWRKSRKTVLLLLTYMQNILFRFLILVRNCISHHRRILGKILLPFCIIGFGFYACTAAQRAIENDIKQIFEISDEIRMYYTDKPDYWGLNTLFLVKNRIIPKRYLHKKNIKLGSGRQILIGSGENAETVMPLSHSFDVIMQGLNKAQCISYAEMPLSEANSFKLLSLKIVNSSGSYVYEWGGNRSLPIEKYATKDLCLDKNNTIIWSIQ